MANVLAVVDYISREIANTERGFNPKDNTLDEWLTKGVTLGLLKLVSFGTKKEKGYWVTDAGYLYLKENKR